MKRNQRLAAAGVATVALLGVAGASIGWDAAQANNATPASRGHCGGTHGMADGAGAPMDAAAKYLGLSRQELITQMHSGKSLSDIAEAEGKSVAGLKAAMVAAMRHSLAADSTLTAAQRTAILAMMKNHLGAMIDGVHMSGMDLDDMGSGMMGGTGTGTGMMGGGAGNGMMGGGAGNGMMGR